MNKSHKKSYATAIGLFAAGLIVSIAGTANAQVGTGWHQVSHSKTLFVELHDVSTTYSPPPSSFNNGGCSYSNSNGIETFKLLNTSSNRCEIVVSGHYNSGSHQVQSYVKVLSPTNNESAIQIKALAPGTSQLLRSYSTNGGRLGVGGSHPLIDNIYGVWVRINYIHDLGRGYTTWYANGSLKYTTGSGAVATYATHYGIYGTLTTSSGTHQFRNITYYDGGSR